MAAIRGEKCIDTSMDLGDEWPWGSWGRELGIIGSICDFHLVNELGYSLDERGISILNKKKGMLALTGFKRYARYAKRIYSWRTKSHFGLIKLTHYRIKKYIWVVCLQLSMD